MTDYLTEEQKIKLNRLLDIEKDLTQIVEDKKAYERVGAQIRSKMMIMASIIGFIALMWDNIKDLIKAAIE